MSALQASEMSFHRTVSFSVAPSTPPPSSFCVRGMLFAGGEGRTNLNTMQMKYRIFSPETILGIVVSFLLCSVSASAQSYIGGSFSLGSSSVGRSQTATTWTRSSSFRVAPDLGWFIGDRWAVGIRPSVGFSNSINSDDAQSRSFSLGINPPSPSDSSTSSSRTLPFRRNDLYLPR